LFRCFFLPAPGIGVHQDAVMILDTRTIFFITFLNVLIMGIGILTTARTYEGQVQRSMTIWGRACLIVIAGWALIGLRGAIPSFLSIVVANALLHFGVAEYYQSLRLFDGQNLCRRYTNILVILMTALLAFFSYIHEHLILRIVISSLVLMFLFALSGWKLLRPPKASYLAMRRFVCFGFAILFAVYMVRALFFLNSPAALPTILANTPLQSFVFGGTSMGFLTVTLGYLLMCNAHFNDQLKFLAATDSLTGLYNRRALTDLSQRELDRARRSGEPPAFFLIDADDFKTINDRYGHDAGDAALQAISSHLKGILRSHDVVGRFGGDEFAALLPTTTETEAIKIAERLSTVVRNTPLLFNHQEIRLSISIGIAAAGREHLDFEDLLHRADQSLYSGKKGRANGG
jgi:diguanylate cyclase (GGDEF)-like protein